MASKKQVRAKRTYTARPGQVVRLAGRRFGSLVVISRAGRQKRYITWLCRCDCGAEREVSGHNLRRGRTKNCGAKSHKVERSLSITAQYKSEYQSWRSMRNRCLDPRHAKYPAYGARGITICERWDEFKNFMLDMGRKSDPKFTIERDDVNGNYEPTNCKWISRKDQGRNKRTSVFVTYQGKKMLLIDLVEELGLSRNNVYQRLKLGWTLAQAIALPNGSRVNRGRPRSPRKKKEVIAVCKRPWYISFPAIDNRKD